MALNESTRRPTAIIFDWDNTLVDSWMVIGDALNTTLTAFGQAAWTPRQVRTRVRKSLRESFPVLFGDQWEQAADLFYTRYGEIHADMVQPISGISAMLEELSGMGIYLAVVSNKRGDYLRKEAEKLGWQKYFGGIVGANDAAHDKPAVDPVHLAMAAGPTCWTESKGERDVTAIWFVGDADIDMECAINAGCTPVLMRRNDPEQGEFAEFPPVWRFQSGQALCKRLRSL